MSESVRVRATLIKTVSDDGIIEMRENVSIGQTYTVELRSIRTSVWGKPDGSIIPMNRFSIFVYDCPDCLEGSWMPLEFLKLEAD